MICHVQQNLSAIKRTVLTEFSLERTWGTKMQQFTVVVQTKMPPDVSPKTRLGQACKYRVATESSPAASTRRLTPTMMAKDWFTGGELTWSVRPAR
jgi:hypothetical protein